MRVTGLFTASVGAAYVSQCCAAAGRTDRIGRVWKRNWNRYRQDHVEMMDHRLKISKAVETKERGFRPPKKQNDKKDKGTRLTGSSSK
jgi:hypothetical protein